MHSTKKKIDYTLVLSYFMMAAGIILLMSAFGLI